MTKLSFFSLLARAEDLKPPPWANVVMPPPEDAGPNRKIFEAFFQTLTGREPSDAEFGHHYTKQLSRLCFHPVFTLRPELMPAAVIAQMRPVERKGNGLKGPSYLQFVEEGRQMVSVEILAGHSVDIALPRKLVLCREARGKMVPTREKVDVNLTKEGLYAFAGERPTKKTVEDGMPLLVAPVTFSPVQSSLFSAHDICKAYSNMDTKDFLPDGKKARRRRKHGPSGPSGFKCTA